MATHVLLIRQGKGLVAADPISHDSLSSMVQAEQVVAIIRWARNPAHHRKMFALLNEVYKNQDFYATLEGMLDDIKSPPGIAGKNLPRLHTGVTGWFPSRSALRTWGRALLSSSTIGPWNSSCRRCRLEAAKATSKNACWKYSAINTTEQY
jgi:hypothetical protein